MTIEPLFAARRSVIVFGAGVTGRDSVLVTGVVVAFGVIGFAGTPDCITAGGATTALGTPPVDSDSSDTDNKGKPVKLGGDGLSAKNTGFGSGMVTRVVRNGMCSGCRAVSCSADADFTIERSTFLSAYCPGSSSGFSSTWGVISALIAASDSDIDV